MRLLYTILFWLALPIILLRTLWRAKFSRTYSYQFAERFGFCSQRLNNCIWVHAVSLGETIAAIPLIQALKKTYPNDTILITNTTATGKARTLAVFGDSVQQTYFPYDLPSIMKRFLNRINPRVLIVMETELWPNLFAECRRRKIPIVVANARLSEKSAKGYQKVASLTAEMLQAVSALAVQAEPDGKRFLQLGLPPERMQITGSLKFDLNLPDNLIERGAELRQTLSTSRPIWIAASTHPGEDEIILAAHRLLQKQFPTALLILVPRHPERFDSVANLIRQQNFTLMRRSEKKPCSPETAVYLGDSMGEMMLLFAVCDVAFVAGSFVQVGGHNTIEPAALKKPVITGPIIFNFAEIGAAMIAAKGMYQVKTADELATLLSRFLQDSEFCRLTGENAFSVVLKNRGALQKQLAVIDRVIGK